MFDKEPIVFELDIEQCGSLTCYVLPLDNKGEQGFLKSLAGNFYASTNKIYNKSF